MTSTEIQSRITQAALTYGVPPEIALGVARAESGFSQGALSPAGAIGVMQLMPATAAGLGVDPYDPEQNIEGGVRLLAQLWTRYGDWSMVLAAYNAGPSRAERQPWPSETQAYVPKVLAYAGMLPGGSPPPVNPTSPRARSRRGSGISRG